MERIAPACPFYRPILPPLLFMSDLLSKCAVCQALLDEEDLFCSNCGAEAPREAPQAAPAPREFTHKFTCSGCGASMSYDASAGTLRCPFCGSDKLEEQASAKDVSPSSVVPFMVMLPEPTLWWVAELTMLPCTLMVTCHQPSITGKISFSVTMKILQIWWWV